MPEVNDPLAGPVIRTQEAAPLQGQTVPFMTGVGGAFTRGGVGSVGFSVLAPAARTMVEGGPDNPRLSHDEAVEQLKAAGPKFDPGVLPAGDVYQTTVDAIKDQQRVVINASDAAERSSSAGGIAQFAAGLAGGLADPLFLALGPLGRLGSAAGEALGIAKGGTLAVRAATGAAEGGAVMGGYTEAQKHVGTSPGDRDITSYEVLRQTGVGMVFGGAMKAAVGQRPMTPELTAKLEGSDAAAKRMKVAVNDVVSPAGAIGKFQIMPNTARQYMGKDFDVKTLHDPAVNAHVNQVILDDLQKRFPDDMEAQVIAYNAGPGRAEAWIKAGRDDAVLPTETQKYLGRAREIRNQNPLAEAAALPPEVKAAAMKTAVAQMAEDSEINVEPVIKNGMSGDGWRSIPPEEKDVVYNRPPEPPAPERIPAAISGDGWRSIPPEEKDVVYNPPHQPEAPPPLADAIPKPGSAIANERLSSDMLAQVNEATKMKVPEGSEFDEVNKQADDAEKIAEHAELMANGQRVDLAFEQEFEGGRPSGPEEHYFHIHGGDELTPRYASEAELRAAHPELSKAVPAGKFSGFLENASGFKAVMAELEEDGKKGDELAKAVDAAVRCGAMKGLE